MDHGLRPLMLCPHCHYNLAGLPENTCPECGAPFDPAQLARKRTRRPLGPPGIICRTGIVTWQVSLGWPLLILAPSLLVWFAAWNQLGHPPRKYIDDPNTIPGIAWHLQVWHACGSPAVWFLLSSFALGLALSIARRTCFFLNVTLATSIAVMLLGFLDPFDIIAWLAD